MTAVLHPIRRRRPADRARLFHALSDDTRVEILDLLQQGELCVCDLQASIGAAQSRLSFHLKVLKEAGLVADRRQGRWAYYRIVPEGIARLHDAVIAMHPARSPLSTRPGAPCCS
jgi:ArsR family transcriptional regulator, arsenate/arsenite/antimonite-responsive transcriptional repressor